MVEAVPCFFVRLKLKLNISGNMVQLPSALPTGKELCLHYFPNQALSALSLGPCLKEHFLILAMPLTAQLHNEEQRAGHNKVNKWISWHLLAV